MGEGNIFSLFTLAERGVPHSRSGCGGYPIPGLGWGWGVSHSRSGVGGYPIPGLGWGRGYPGQIWMEGGTSSQVWMVGGGMQGTPWPGLDGGGVSPWPGLNGGR